MKKVLFAVPLLSIALFSACDSMKRLTEGRDDAPTVLSAPKPAPTESPSPTPTGTPTPTPAPGSGDPKHDPCVCHPDGRHPFEIYNDRTNPFNLGPEVTESDAPEGARYLRIASGSIGTNMPPTDLSAFFGGTVRFFIRLHEPLQPDQEMLLSIASNDGGEPFPTLSAVHGFSPTSTEWQSVTVPLNFYTREQFEIFAQPFGIVIFGPGENVGFDLDDIRWIKP